MLQKRWCYAQVNLKDFSSEKMQPQQRFHFLPPDKGVIAGACNSMRYSPTWTVFSHSVEGAWLHIHWKIHTKCNTLRERWIAQTFPTTWQVPCEWSQEYQKSWLQWSGTGPQCKHKPTRRSNRYAQNTFSILSATQTFLVTIYGCASVFWGPPANFSFPY